MKLNIIEHNTPSIALCTLGSINWGKYEHPQQMRKACRAIVRALSNVLDYQDFLSVQSHFSNQEFRPLGIGVTNLAYWHAKRGFKYGEPNALAEVKRWMEHQAFYVLEASVDLAEERGACIHSQHTCYHKGIFPFELRARGVNELTDFTPSPDLDYDTLRARMMRFGVHNGLLLAVAPVESSSVVLDSTNGMEKLRELISVKESKAGSLVQVAPEYNRLKDKYECMWDDTDCIGYIKTAAVMGVYVDQSLSTNTYYNPAHFPRRKVPMTLVARNAMLAQHWGLKTLYYSILNKLGAAQVEDDVDAPIRPVEIVDQADEESCSACVL